MARGGPGRCPRCKFYFPSVLSLAMHMAKPECWPAGTKSNIPVRHG